MRVKMTHINKHIAAGNLVVRDNNYTLELLQDESGEPEAKVG